MKRNNAISVGEAIRKALREQGLETPLNQQRLMSAWPQIVGEGIANYTSDLFIKNQTLYMHVSSSALRQELMMARKQLVRSLNKVVGAQIICDIQFR
jgi:predicted nucleic acid-binding Zn ribbon protein